VLTGTAASAAVLKAGLTTKLLLSTSLQFSTSRASQVTMHRVADNIYFSSKQHMMLLVMSALIAASADTALHPNSHVPNWHLHLS
jgi:hypothetical protein